MQTLFQYFRRGRLYDAIDLCESSDQFWRAASLRGGFLRSDRTLNEVKEIEGNSNRMLWKYTCYALSQENFDPYERALYAGLCGNFHQMEPVLKTWEDTVWAYFQVHLEHLIDKTLSEKGMGLYSTPMVQLNLPYFEPNISKFFDSLIHNEKEAIKYFIYFILEIWLSNRSISFRPM